MGWSRRAWTLASVAWHQHSRCWRLRTHIIGQRTCQRLRDLIWEQEAQLWCPRLLVHMAVVKTSSPLSVRYQGPPSHMRTFTNRIPLHESLLRQASTVSLLFSGNISNLLFLFIFFCQSYFQSISVKFVKVIPIIWHLWLRVIPCT